MAPMKPEPPVTRMRSRIINSLLGDQYSGGEAAEVCGAARGCKTKEFIREAHGRKDWTARLKGENAGVQVLDVPVRIVVPREENGGRSGLRF